MAPNCMERAMSTSDEQEPILPYEFDLLWDAKTRGDLVRLLTDDDVCFCERDLVRDAMNRHGIVLAEAEQLAVATDEVSPAFR
jgi:hypothetical protein